jgi:pimeloyl-ACP methyl ester carboxylesterase
MYWMIMCNEPWVGLAVRGPWGTYLDGSTEAALAGFAAVCPLLPRAPQSAADWRRPSGRTPVLALVGGADPQDPVQNLEGLARSLPRSRIVVVPGQGHTVGQYGCLGRLVARFVERGTAAGLDVRCARTIPVPRFVLR